MKTNITIYIVTFIIFLAYSFSLYKWGESNERKDNREKYIKLLNEAEQESDLLASSIEVLLSQIDPLKSIPEKIVYKEKIKAEEINTIIASDSNLAIGEYRKGLKLLDIKPDIDSLLTNREIGYGALLFNELKSKREQLFNSFQIQGKQTEVISELESQKKNLLNQVALLKASLTTTESFWDNRFAPFLGIGLSYNGKTIEPALQLGFGIRIN